MALNFFKQSEIDAIDIDDIPEEFINYFDSLDEAGKKSLVNARQDLANALDYHPEISSGDENDGIKQDSDSRNTVKTEKQLADPEGNESSEVYSDEDELLYSQNSFEDHSLERIRINAYEGMNIEKSIKDNMSPFEVLAIGDNDTQCMLHHTQLKEKNIRFKVPNYPVLGVKIKLCKQCKRIFIEESKMGYLDLQLMNRKIPHTFYTLDTTKNYLQTLIKPYFFTENSMLFVQKTWVDENPTCPCTTDYPKLHMIPCKKEYKGRSVSFTGYQCEKCKRIYVRRSKAFELEDECASLGIPRIRRFRIERKVPGKSAIPADQLHPDYYVENGRRIRYHSEHRHKCYKLNEEDILVVSDVKSCMLDGHETKTVLVLIRVDEKKEEEIYSYACEVGFCADCMKYYIEADDYNVLYSKGRPEVSVLINLDDSNYHITSGSEFNLEKDHLRNVEDVLNNEVSKITLFSDYVSKYETGDYDDGALSFKKKNAGKYDESLKKLHRFMPKPYSYRVDIMSADESETYYVGASDITLNGINYVISANSNFGHQLVSYQTTKINKDGRDYRLKLTRRFDISHAVLYGYTNVRTDEDAIFKKGITDPFLIRVLTLRKKQHNLTDIFVTIQENQNKIVNALFDRNLIVQGCAGSGKTMVLLHRLSSLCYKEKSFDFGSQALILTPNENFSTHIKGLSEDLHIRYIEKLTVEQYYSRTLLEYSEDFKLDGNISSEMIVRQDFVNFIYSNRFKTEFSKAYLDVIKQRNRLGEIINQLAESIDLPRRDYSFTNNVRVFEQLNSGIQSLIGAIKLKEEKYQKASEEYQKIIIKKHSLEEQVPKLNATRAKTCDDAITRSFHHIQKYLYNHQLFLSRMENEHLQLLEKRTKGIKAKDEVMERKKRVDLNNEIRAIESRILSATQRLEKERVLLTPPPVKKTQEETFEWIRSISHIVPNVEEELLLYDRIQRDFEHASNELLSMDQKIETLKMEMDQFFQERYPEQIRKKATRLEESVLKYTPKNTFQIIFDEATNKYKKENKIKNINGKYHRYDLYAMLLFAQMFFDTKPKGFLFICVDEGQDISENEYRLIRDLNDPNAVFNVFGDVNQLMKPGRGISNWAQLDKIIGAKKYFLNENYRNTNQITRFCNESFGMDVVQIGVDGANVRELRRTDLESELSSLNLISERVALLVPRKGKTKKKYLKEDLLSDEVKEHIGDHIGNGYISIMYVDEVKGIEFDKAYVVPKGMTKNEKYIAYTRALSELVIVVDE